MDKLHQSKKVICGIAIGSLCLLLIGTKTFLIKTSNADNTNDSQIINTEDIDRISAINTEVLKQTGAIDKGSLNEVPAVDTEASKQTRMTDTEDLNEVLAANTEDLDNSQTISEAELRAWVGEYTFLELDTTPAGSPMMMDFAIKIYENGYADISVNGQTTYISARAEVYGNREEIRLVFAECLPEDVTSGDYWDDSDILVSFRKSGDDIYTYWGELKSVVLLYSDQVSGKIYFTKNNAKSDQDSEEAEKEHVVYAAEKEEDSSKIFEKEMEQASLKKVADGYELTLYDKDYEKVYSEIYPTPAGSIKVPEINELSGDLLEISMSVGSPAVYIYFFDKETAEISPTYFNPIVLENKYIAYMDDDKGGVLIFTDIFQRGEVYIEVEKNFAPYANPMDAVIDIKIIDSCHIELQYYEGEDFAEKSEVILVDIK